MTAFGDTLAALQRTGIAFWVRKDPERAGELDLSIAAGDLAGTAAALAGAGYHPLDVAGHRDHRFFLRYAEPEWSKVDVKLSRRVRRRRAIRRRGPIVALLGPDGAGKGTVAEALAGAIPIGVDVVNLGWAPRRTRSGGGAGPVGPEGGARRRGSALREAGGVLRAVLSYGVRLAPAYRRAFRGDVVLCDRHPVEVLAVRPPRTPVAGALERLVFGRLFPAPDAIVVLEAPAEVLVARKREHTPAILDRWAKGYRDEFGGRARFVSSDRDRTETIAEVSRAVWDALAARQRW